MRTFPSFGIVRLAAAFGILLASAPASAAPSAAEKQALLGRHNLLRAQLAGGTIMGQPPAANMTELLWDPGLAAVAQAWADQCNFGHNPNRGTQLAAQPTRFTKPSNPFVGENIAALAGPPTEAKLVQGVNLWWDEVASYTFGTAFSPSTGHYTQVAWATTRYLGCGVANCSPLQGAPFSGTFLVCNYYQAGNFAGQTPYVSGTACSACPADRPVCSNQLCAGCTSSADCAAGETCAAAQCRPPVASVPGLPPGHLLLLGLSLSLVACAATKRSPQRAAPSREAGAGSRSW